MRYTRAVLPFGRFLNVLYDTSEAYVILLISTKYILSYFRNFKNAIYLMNFLIRQRLNSYI